MKKKRKGSECDAVLQEVLQSICNSRSSLSSRKSHFSFEDVNLRSTKRCKEEECVEDAGSFKSRLDGIATAPPCGSSSLVAPGRGIKRKIGCIDVSTQIRKNKLEDDYILDSTIGQGKFGSVWLCRSRSSGEEFACKTLLKGEETVHREVEIMQHLSGHQGVVTLEAVYEEAECFHLVMELCSGGRLIDQMSKDGEQLSEHRAANIFKEVMLVIKYCHDMGVVHRDIKPENILLTSSGKIKLADFGLAMRVASGQGLNGLAGSAAYVAPEVLLGNYSEKVDIWSTGVLLHALLVGVLPFKGDSLDAVFEAIKTVKLDFHTGIWESVSKPARNLIEKMLTRDASARITAEEVLRHPWILFYTDRSLKILSIKSRSKNVVAHQVESEKKKMEKSPLHECSFESSSSDNEKQDECDLVDALTGAVSQVRISEPKRTRLCVSSTSSRDNEEQSECALVDALTGAVSQVRISEPKRTRLRVPNTSPIPQQCSSNMSSNNLCKAF